jgi:hypothetical protein
LELASLSLDDDNDYPQDDDRKEEKSEVQEFSLSVNSQGRHPRQRKSIQEITRDSALRRSPSLPSSEADSDL